MDSRKLAAICGIVAPVVIIIAFGLTIAMTPGHDMQDDWIGDLGVVEAGYIYTFGLILAGILTIIFSLELRKKIMSGYLVFIGGILLIGIALVNKNYGEIHITISALFFVTMILALALTAWPTKNIPTWMRIFSIFLAGLTIFFFVPEFDLGRGYRELFGVIIFMVYFIIFGIFLYTKKPEQPEEEEKDYVV